jgi:hypothetical protein
VCDVFFAVFTLYEILEVPVSWLVIIMPKDTYYLLLWIIVSATRTESRPLSILNLYDCSCTSVIIFNVCISVDKYLRDIFNFINHAYQIALKFVYLSIYSDRFGYFVVRCRTSLHRWV